MQAAMIGVGSIGTPMARRVLEAGVDLRVYDTTRSQVDALAASGATAATSPAEAAQGASAVGVMVRSDEQALDCTLGKRGALETMAAGAVVVVQSTVLPETVEQIAAAAAGRGIGVVDAPVTGGVPGAEAGTLTIMAGGSEADLATCRPLLEPMSKLIIHTGARGSGMVAKLCNNLVSYLSYLAIFEADQLARRAGLSAEMLDEILGSAGLMTNNMRNYVPLARQTADRTQEPILSMLERVTDLAEKDLGHTLACARSLGLELPATALCREQMGRVYRLPSRDDD